MRQSGELQRAREGRESGLKMRRGARRETRLVVCGGTGEGQQVCMECRRMGGTYPW